MSRLQELVRLHRMGVSARRSARMLGMSRNTVRTYQTALAAAGLLSGSVDELPELDALRRAVDEREASRKPAQEVSSVNNWLERIQALSEDGNGPKAIYDLLRLEDPDFTGSYDAVKRLCRRLRRERPVRPSDVAIPVETAPGPIAQVDFGYVGKLLDPAEKRLRKAYVFVIVLGHSRHMFAEVVFDQRAETWQRLHVAAFHYFGGVPRVIVPDNLKAAVIRNAFDTSGEVELNRSYVELARHFGFQIDPTPPRSPEKKGKVEASVKYVKTSFFKPRKGEHLDIHAASAGLKRWLAEIAAVREHGTTRRQPIEVFTEVEQQALLSLPMASFEPVRWQVAKVHADSHVQYCKRLYSVPYRLVGQQVWIRATATAVMIYAHDERVATHEVKGPSHRSTDEHHLPEHRSAYRHRTREYWEEQAAALGEDVLTYVAEIFEAEDVLLQLRKVQGIVTHLKGFPAERANAACRRASFYCNYSTRGIKDILRKGLDFEPLPDVLLPSHGRLAEPRFARPPSTFTQPPTEA